MKLSINLSKTAELSISLIFFGILVLAGCGGGSSTGAGSATVSTFSYNNGIPLNFIAPWDITSDGTNLYVTDIGSHNIRKIVIATGQVTTFAGSITGASGVADAPSGPATNALFFNPAGITVDSSNLYLYVADSGNNSIRRIEIATGAVTTIAGSTTGVPGAVDGIDTNASFNYPIGISRIGSSLFVADMSNCMIRKIDLTTGSAVVSTLAGSPPPACGYSDNLAGASAVFMSPSGLTNDGTSLYLTDLGNHDVRKIDPVTGFTTLAAGGNHLLPNFGRGSVNGSASAARFDNPRGITTDGTYLYVADSNNHTIRKISITSGNVTTLAGLAGASGVADGTTTDARFYFPMGIILLNGYLYVTDFGNSRIRRIQL